MNTIPFLLNLLYPPKCLSCGELLWPNETLPLCPKCLEEWEKLRKVRCKVCKQSHEVCHCAPPILKDMQVRVSHLVPYTRDTVAGRLLLLAKDERLPVLTDFLADELTRLLKRQIATDDTSAWVITYLPRGRRRALESGVDQGRALAKALGKRMNLSVMQVFRRRNSVAQKDLDTAEERLRAARRSYRLKKRLPNLAGKKILLVDDIFTTGSTMIAGAELLRSAGAGEIHCVTVGKSEKAAEKSIN